MGPSAPATKSGLPPGEPRDLVRRPAREPRGRQIQLGCEFGQAVVGLGDRGGVEGVRGDQVGAGLEILAVNLRDHLRPRERQQIVVAREDRPASGRSDRRESQLRPGDAAGSWFPWRRRERRCGPPATEEALARARDTPSCRPPLRACRSGHRRRLRQRLRQRLPWRLGHDRLRGGDCGRIPSA